jgi:hypothetical protein
VQELTSRFIDLGVKAAGALINLGAKGVELNKNLEVSGRVFTNLFGDVS